MSARISYTSNLLRLCRGKSYERKLFILVSSELICEFLKQCLIIVSACLASLQKFLKGKSDLYE